MIAVDTDDGLRDPSKATLTCQHQITKIGYPHRPPSWPSAWPGFYGRARSADTASFDSDKCSVSGVTQDDV